MGCLGKSNFRNAQDKTARQQNSMKRTRIMIKMSETREVLSLANVRQNTVYLRKKMIQIRKWFINRDYHAILRTYTIKRRMYI